jgi:toxin FitB
VKWLLDTNVVSEGIRKTPSRRVMTWLAAQAASELAISIVTVAELRDGVSSIPDKERRRTFNSWIDAGVIGVFRTRILPTTVDTLTDWVRLARVFRSGGDPRDPADLLIASTARTRNLVLVTRNIRHFASTGITVYNPWTDETHRMESP